MSVHQAAGVAPSPWTTRERVTLVVLLAVGIIGLGAGYAGTSGTLRVSRQVVWINAAGAALLVSGAGVVLFLTAGRRAIGRRRLGLFGDVVDAAATEVHLGTITADDLVAAPMMTRYHRADCSFVAGKAGVAAASAAAHRQAGRRPCGVCLPGGEKS